MKLNNEYPLGLPEGSVRAILALSMIVFVFVWFFEFKTIPKELVGIVTFVITYYFTKRDGYTRKLIHYKIRYKINEKSKITEVIITAVTPGEAIDKLRNNLKDTEYLNLMIEEINRLN